MTPSATSDAPTVKLPGNPFVVESPEKLSPQQIVDLFVKEYTPRNRQATAGTPSSGGQGDRARA